MNKLYYRGNAYDFKIVKLTGITLFALYTNGELIHYANEEDLDIRSRVTLILDAYYTKSSKAFSTPVATQL